MQEYHVVVYFLKFPDSGRLFKVMAESTEKAKEIARKEAKKVLDYDKSSLEVKNKIEDILAESDFIVGLPGQGCTCEECDKPLSQILQEN